MDTVILNFKKKEIVADCKNDAVEMANELFQINGDATQAFNNWKAEQVGGITERDVKAFMLDYLARKSKNAPGIGYIITLNPAVIDTRNRPYQVEDFKNEGKRQFKSVYVWKDIETGTVVCKVDTNKSDAKTRLKEMYKCGEYRGNAELIKMKEVVKGNPVVATAKYTPSKNTRKGTWMIFGIEA